MAFTDSRPLAWLGASTYYNTTVYNGRVLSATLNLAVGETLGVSPSGTWSIRQNPSGSASNWATANDYDATLIVGSYPSLALSIGEAGGPPVGSGFGGGYYSGPAFMVRGGDHHPINIVVGTSPAIAFTLDGAQFGQPTLPQLTIGEAGWINANHSFPTPQIISVSGTSQDGGDVNGNWRVLQSNPPESMGAVYPDNPGEPGYPLYDYGAELDVVADGADWKWVILQAGGTKNTAVTNANAGGVGYASGPALAVRGTTRKRITIEVDRGDIRKVYFAIIDQLAQSYLNKPSADRPTKMAVSKSTSVSAATGILTTNFNFQFQLYSTGLEVVDES